MHKMLLNTLKIDLAVIPNGPILIKSGMEEGVDPTLPNMNFVRGFNPLVGTQTIYIPGSSLKGVIRSHAERIIRTVLPNPIHCCDPLSDNACGEKAVFKTSNRRESPLSGADTYRQLCTACRIFGHTVMGSRLIISDAYPNNEEDVESLPTRQMVAIDRRSGASVNTFTMEVATRGEFEFSLMFRNFERWQIGLIALVVRDLNEGRLSIGFGKSRGLGQVKIAYRRAELIYPAGRAPLASTHLYGVGELLDDEQIRAAYDFMPPINVSDRETEFSANDVSLIGDWQTQVEIDPEQAEFALAAQVPAWAGYVRWKGHTL